MKLHSKINDLRLAAPRVLRIREDLSQPSNPKEALLLSKPIAQPTEGYGLVLNKSNGLGAFSKLPPELDYLGEGDIVRVGTDGDIWVMYRKNSRHNSMLVTERCNSKCVMCSQPPRDVEDSFLIDEWLEALPLMAKETVELGITGGEPTLYFEKLLDLIAAAKEHLPTTAIHLLSNGRSFCQNGYAERLSSLNHPDLMLGIPLYADVADLHDCVVQAKGAFDETIFGLLNLARLNQRIEIRCVIHRLTFQRLPELARFIARNLPFVEHVALMGLEIMGYTRSNLEALWIEPAEYHVHLSKAVEELALSGIRVSIYNHPLCLIPQHLWPYARQSISDWKNIYFPECDNCAVKRFCGGFFASAQVKRSRFVHALDDSDFKRAAEVFSRTGTNNLLFTKLPKLSLGATDY